MDTRTTRTKIERLCLADFCKPGEESHYHLAVVADRSTVHTHDFFEIELVTEGRLWIETNGEARIVPEGRVILTRPEDCHRLGSADRTPCRFMNLAFSPAVMQDLGSFLGHSNQLEALLTAPSSPVAQPAPHPLQAMRLRMEALPAIPATDRDRCRNALRMLIASVIVDGFLEPAEGGDCPAWMARTLQAMQRQPHLREGLPALFRLSGLHPDSVSRAFRRCLGITPTAWLQEIRLTWFANSLAHSDDPILALALDAGFDNLSHCYHLFGRRFGCAPGAYRNRHRSPVG